MPTSSDNVFFDSGSGTCTVTTSGTTTDVCANLTWSSSNVTISHAANTTIGIYGSMDFTGAGTYTRGNATTSRLKFQATATGKTITFNGKNPGDITFDGVGGGWTLQDAFSNGSSVWTLTNGALDTNGKSLTTSTFDGSNSNTRSLTLGSTTWTLSGNVGTPWNLTTTTNLTFSGASSTIIMPNPTSAITFASGALTYGTVTVTGNGFNNTRTLSGAFTCSALNLGNAGSVTLSLILDANVTCTGTITLNHTATANFGAQIRSDTLKTARTLSAGTVTVTDGRWSFRDITAAGAATWDLSGAAEGSGDCGGNTGITFTTGANRYYVGNTANFDGTNVWATSSGGAGATANHPLAQDTAIFDANSFSAGSQTITVPSNSMSLHGMPHIDFTNVTNNPTLTLSGGTPHWTGGFILKPGMTLNSTASTFTIARSGNLTLGGITWPTGAITFNGYSGTLTQTANIASSANCTFTAGTLAGGTYTQSWTVFSMAGGSMTGVGLVTLTGAASNSGGTLSIVGFTGGTTHAYTGGTTTIGASGITGSTFTNNGGTFTLNGASTGMTGNMTLSGGAVNLNANYTTSGTLSISNDMTLTVTSATLNTSTINIVGAGSGGGLAANPLGGFIG